MRVLIVESRYHAHISDALADGATRELEKCGASFERWRDGQKHGRDDHGSTPAELERVRALVNSAAIDWSGDSLALSVSVGDPRGAFVLIVRQLDDGTRLMHVPHPDDSMPHMRLTELHPGTYRIG